MRRKPIATEYILLTNQWEAACPDVIADNVDKYLVEKYQECIVRSVMYEKLSGLTGSSKHTVYAWFNKSRERVKIPLGKLCIIAEALHTDVWKFFE